VSGLTIAAILAELDQGDPGLTKLVVGPPDREVRAVWLAEELRDVENGPDDALVVLSEAASREAHGYKLDVALRRLGHVAGLVVRSEVPRLSLSALALAQREGIPLVHLRRPADTTALIGTVSRLLDAGIPLLLERTIRVCQQIERAEATDTTDEALIQATGAGQLFGLTLGRHNPALQGVPAVLTDPHGRWIQRELTIASEDTLAQLAMWRLAAALTKRSISAERAEQVSLLSAGELLNQLLGETADDSGPLVRRASDVGIAVAAWHEAVEMKFENLLMLVEDDTVAAYQYTQVLAQVAAQTARHQGRWTMAPRAGGVLLLRTQAHPSDLAGLRKLRSTVEMVLERAREVLPGIQILCGVGGCHEGLQGLRASQAEALSALQSARLRKVFNEPMMFDAPGLSRLLVEWYSSSSVRQGIQDLLAPLAKLGTAKQKEYLTTLRLFLENNKSQSRTAEQMLVHRNTIAYRVSRIVELLGIDLDDPSQFLAVYLACYAQSLPHVSQAGSLPRTHGLPGSAPMPQRPPTSA
jgi:sugar diacid utilization regulator